MTLIILVLDAGIVAGALVSAWLWWLSGRQRVRRISRTEVLDAADVNRIVTALNRTQILNSRAALATAAASVFAACRLALDGLSRL